MIELGHRERVLRSIEYRDIDRTPSFYRAEPVVNMKIKQKYGLKGDMEIIRLFNTDAVQILVLKSPQYANKSREDGTFTDIFGNRFKAVQYGDISSYTVIEPVLAEAEDPDDVGGIKWPGRDFVDIEASVKAAKEARETGLAVYGGVWASLFTNSRSIMGEENFLISLIDNPELVSALIERLTDFYIDVNEVYFQACSKYIDVFYFGSDFGTQNSMFISREMFCRFFKPSFKRLVDHAKGFGLKVMYHTCGSVTSIINDLIDCGIDVLDPVQASAAGMEPALLAEKFKGRIAFHGGISTQTTLPFGTPEEVRYEVIRLINTLGPTGLIAGPDQDMIGDIPLENIEMMFKTISAGKCYSW